MTLGEFTKFLGVKVNDAAFVHHAIGDVAGCDQVAQPLGRIGVDLVVESAHACDSMNATTSAKVLTTRTS